MKSDLKLKFQPGVQRPQAHQELLRTITSVAKLLLEIMSHLHFGITVIEKAPFETLKESVTKKHDDID